MIQLTYKTAAGETIRQFTPPKGWTLRGLKNDLDRATAVHGITVRAFMRLDSAQASRASA